MVIHRIPNIAVQTWRKPNKERKIVSRIISLSYCKISIYTLLYQISHIVTLLCENYKLAQDRMGSIPIRILLILTKVLFCYFVVVIFCAMFACRLSAAVVRPFSAWCWLKGHTYLSKPSAFSMIKYVTFY